MKIRKISRCRSRFQKYVEFSVTLLLCRGPLRNVQRFVTHVHSLLFAAWHSRCSYHRGLLKFPIGLHTANDKISNSHHNFTLIFFLFIPQLHTRGNKLPDWSRQVCRCVQTKSFSHCIPARSVRLCQGSFWQSYLVSFQLLWECFNFFPALNALIMCSTD